jgi:hypothetical protein
MTKIYSLIKSAIIDVSSYVHVGLSIDDIEDVFERVLLNTKSAVIRPIPSLLMYELKTIYEKDDDVIKLVDKITTELDILIVEYKEKTFYDT